MLVFPLFQSLKSSSENLNGNHADSHQTNHSRRGFAASLLNENGKKHPGTFNEQRGFFRFPGDILLEDILLQ